MSQGNAVTRWLERMPIARSVVAARRLRRRQRDWTTTQQVRFGRTSLSFCTTIGIGDVMIARQVCETFSDLCQQQGDLKLGRIVVTAGTWLPEYRIPRADHHVYWWWSMNGQADWLERYLGSLRRPPDVVACLSQGCVDEAESHGVPALLLPLGVGRHFQPLDLPRDGVGYAGSRKHKDPEQEQAVVGPFVERDELEWVDNLQTPQALCTFYNRKQIVLGMTERLQEQTGMVNNRVFEVLATGTPFIIHRHRNLEQTLGFSYPYQTSSAAETRRLAEQILGDYPAASQQAAAMGAQVREHHSYTQRLKSLFAFLDQRR